MKFPFTQIRIARPTASIKEIIKFYRDGLGLKETDRFNDHDGYNGIMFGLPDESYHLEFTEHINEGTFPPPTNDNLLVFYLAELNERDRIAAKLSAMGYLTVEPEILIGKRKELQLKILMAGG